MNSEVKNCQNCKIDFTIESEDFNFYEKIDVPAPNKCPWCRLVNRLTWRNERSLYKRACDLCKKEGISIYHPDKDYVVYCSDCYYSDNWDPLEFKQEYDPSRSFFEQFDDLLHKVPRLALLQENSVNSPWVNYETDDKNCYFNFGGHDNEDSAYNQYALKDKDCFDNYWVQNSEYCYGSVICINSYKTFFSAFCDDCRDVWFSFDCRNCSNCIGCTGLRHAEYYIFNEKVTKEEYERFIEDEVKYTQSNISKMRAKFYEMIRSNPQRSSRIDTKSVNVTGNFIRESKNCHQCFNVEQSENCKFMLHNLDMKDSYDTVSVWKGELIYDSIAGVDGVANIKFSEAFLHGSRNCEYSNLIFNCQDCFGCISLKGKKNCILNKQYDDETYQKLLAQLKAEMINQGEYGEFFPQSISPFGYNETVALEYNPLTKQQAEEQGFTWNEYRKDSNHSATIDYIEDIRHIDDSVTKEIFTGTTSGKAYRVIPMELQFCKRFGIPLPNEDPFTRHVERLKFFNIKQEEYEKMCEKCGTKTLTRNDPKVFDKLYCDECYLQEIA